MRIVRGLCVALIGSSLLVASAEDEPRVAVVYSSFRGGACSYKDEQTPVLAALAWPQEQYENTRITELIPRLSEYALVIFNTVSNYENSQDLARFAKEWRAYLERGGCLVITDANYEPQFGWLPAVDPGLRWIGSGKSNDYAEGEAKWVARDHPLMTGVTPPRVPWTYPLAWSHALTPLMADSARRPIVAYLEVGKGLVVIGSAYQQYGWPEAQFYRNLVTWSKDEGRLAACAERKAAQEKAAQTLPNLTVPHLKKAPEIDGEIGEAEWAEAAVIPQFVDMNATRNLTQQTMCRVAQGPGALYVAFECSDTDVTHVVKRLIQRDAALWTDDCVEVFLDPSGERKGFFHFVVNAAGAQYDAQSADPSWDRYWTVKTSVKPGSWCAEISLPFAALDITTSNPPGKTWAANFCREYQARSGLGQEISGWSPTFSGFHVVSRYGSLSGINVAASRYVCQPEIRIRVPERWFMGDNAVKVTVTPVGGKAARVGLACVDVGTGYEVGKTRLVMAKPGQTAEITVPLALGTDGPHTRQFVAYDAETVVNGRHTVLAASRVIHIETAPVVEANVILPSFRHSVQSRDPRRELWVKGFVGDTKARDLRFRASLTQAGRSTPAWQQGIEVASRQAFGLRAPVADLPVGDYVLRMDLEDGERSLLASQQRDLRVLPPAPVEVSFDHRRACFVNGKPFFPLGLYHVSEPVVDLVNGRAREIGLPTISVESMLKQVKDHGFNCVVRGWGMPTEGFLKTAQETGVYVLPEVGAPDPAALEKMISLANQFSSVLMWYGIDEPAGDRLQQALEAHERFMRLDPHRPVSAACNNPAHFEAATRAYDVLMMDPYFIRYAPLSGIAGWVEAGMRIGQGRVPIWVVPQAFAVDNSPWLEPTNEELRCQAYLSIVHGATGLIWYAYFTTEPYTKNPKGRNQWFLPDSHLWDCFPKLNAEIQQLAPVILEGESRGPARSDNPGVHTQVWEHKGARYLIAVNATDKPVECCLSGLDGDMAEVMFEHRTASAREGTLRDTFKPLETHVYRFKRKG